MRCCLVTPYWRNSYGGGIKSYAITLADIIRSNDDVFVLFREGVDDKQFYMGYNKLIFIIRCLFYLIKLKPDTIISLAYWHCLFPCVLYKKLFHIKVFFKPLSEPSDLNPIFKVIYKKLVDNVDSIIFQSNVTRCHFETILGFKFKHVSLVPLAVKPKPVSEKQIALFYEKYKIKEGSKVLLVQGFLSNELKYEGLLLVLDSIKKLINNYDIKLIITGEGIFKNKIEKYVEKACLNDYVIFTGLLKNAFIPLALCDVFLFPWTGHDGGVALIEAMSCGKPIIYTRKTGELSEIIENNKDGLIVKPRVNELANNIRYLLNNSDVAIYLSSNAKKKALTQYSWAAMDNQLKSLFIN